MRISTKKALYGLTLATAIMLSGCGNDIIDKQPHDTSKQKHLRVEKKDWTWEVSLQAALSNGSYVMTPQFWEGVPDEVVNMQYFIDIDRNTNTGFSASGSWEIKGADYLIENGQLYKSQSRSNWSWKHIGAFNQYSFKNKRGVGSYDTATIATNDQKIIKIFNTGVAFKMMMEPYDSKWVGAYNTIVGVDAELGGVVSPPPVPPKPNDQGKKVAKPDNNQIYFGAYANFGHGENQVTSRKIHAFEDKAQKDVSWVCFTNNWKNGLNYPKDKIHLIQNLGKIPFVRFLPASEEDEGARHNLLQNIIDGNYDDGLKEWAKDAKNDGTPIMMDFGVEMTGFWMPWSGKWQGGGETSNYGDSNYPDGPERFRDAYRHIIDIFRAQGAKNITWFFHPDIQRLPDEEWNSAKYYYPGDDYIDWIGISIYGAMFEEESWRTFSDSLKEKARWIKEITNNKPIAILETGVTDFRNDGDKAQWFKEAFADIIAQRYLKFSAYVYWNESWTNEDGTETNLNIDSSKESLRAFRRGISNSRFISKTNFTQ